MSQSVLMQIARDKSTQRTGRFLASQARRKQQQRQKVDHWLLLTPSLFLCRLLYRVANSDHDAQRGRSYLSIYSSGWSRTTAAPTTATLLFPSCWWRLHYG